MNLRIMAVSVFLLGTCLAARADYRTEVEILPAAEAHQYMVRFKIMDVAADGKADVMSAPAVVTRAGEEAKVSVVNEAEDSGVFCTVLVKETEGGGLDVCTNIVLKEKGEEKLNSTQRVMLKK